MTSTILTLHLWKKKELNIFIYIFIFTCDRLYREIMVLYSYMILVFTYIRHLTPLLSLKL